MTLTSLIQNLESRLKKAEKLTRQYDSHASALRGKLTDVANAVGERLPGMISTARASLKKGRKMTRAGRARIIAALKKRWAAFHAKHGAKATGGRKRRTISKAHKKAAVRKSRRSG